MKEKFKELSFEELIETRKQLIQKYQQLRFDLITGHVENKLDVRSLRRRIATLNTLIYNHQEVTE